MKSALRWLWIASVMLCAACGTKPSIAYLPEFLPVSFSIGPSGISIKGQVSMATPIGEFSIGATYSLPQPGSGSIYVILRDQQTGFDHIYRVAGGTDNLTAVVNGTTRISVFNNQVLIDVTSGQVEDIQFEHASGIPETASSASPWYTSWWAILIWAVVAWDIILFWIVVRNVK
jgi:hypothetical protein